MAQPTFTPAAISSCRWATSARVQGRPAGRGPVTSDYTEGSGVINL
jgi:hypothetical protein